MTLKRFVSVRGFPYMMHSDAGPQLVAANKELRDMVKQWDKNKLFNFGANEGIKWSFNKSDDSPWENGCSEALVKLVKRAITVAIGSNVLTFSGLQTALFEIANLLNEKSIGIKPGNELSLGSYVCPNDLLLGRTCNKVPSGMWQFTKSNKIKLEYIERIVSSFWKKWQRDYFPTLLVRQKWHVERRNVKIDDIVLLQDSNSLKGTWRRGRVITANAGRDDKVRDVTVHCKCQKQGARYSDSNVLVKRSVHRLVVLLPVEEQCNT